VRHWLRRYWFAALIGLLLVVALVFRDWLPGTAQNLLVGDCFDPPSSGAFVINVPHHPCSEPHLAEVIFVGDHPGGSFPGDAALEEFVAVVCLPAFEAYVGHAYASDTELDVTAFYPTSLSWRRGDHGVTCYVVRVDAGTMTSSVKASAD
jgi:hypothetical protein